MKTYDYIFVRTSENYGYENIVWKLENEGRQGYKLVWIGLDAYLGKLYAIMEKEIDIDKDS